MHGMYLRTYIYIRTYVGNESIGRNGKKRCTVKKNFRVILLLLLLLL